MEALVALPGVARKTANVVLGVAYGIAAGMVVDTHTARVSQRLGLTKETDAVAIETALCALFPQEQWIDMSHRFILHGRYQCFAQAPMCATCPLNEVCPSREAEPEGPIEDRAQLEGSRVARRDGANRAGVGSTR
jgi:endonuclease-3